MKFDVTTAKAAIKKMGFMGAVGHGANIGFAVSDYNDNREQGKGVISSAVGAAVDNALPFIIGPYTYLAGALIMNAPGAMVSAAESVNQTARSLEKAGRSVSFNNTTFVDTEQAYTMRQAGMALAERSKYNVQQTMLGNEARHLHR